MENQVPEEIKTRRSNVLIEMNKKKMKMYEQTMIGTKQEVLVEEAIEKDGETYQVGHTKEYVKIAYKCDENLSNQIIFVELNNSSQIIH